MYKLEDLDVTSWKMTILNIRSLASLATKMTILNKRSLASLMTVMIYENKCINVIITWPYNNVCVIMSLLAIAW